MAFYFQRYSQGENHITNSTLMLFQYIYQSSPAKLQVVLVNLTENKDINIGLDFINQKCEKNGNQKSVLDGYIVQKPINIYIEAKVGNNVDNAQLQRHLTNISQDSTLICLTRDEVSPHNHIPNVYYITYDKIVNTVAGEIKDWETQLNEIFVDYQALLQENNLLTNPLILFASAAGRTLEMSQQTGVYYDGFHRPERSNANYIGLYKDKAIRLVGKIEAVVVYDEKSGMNIERGNKNKELHYKKKILEAIELSREIYDIKEIPHRYFITEKFHEVEFKKKSSGGLLGLKYFNLRDDHNIQKEDKIKDIVQKLNQQEW